jgi:DNA-binding LacI/PurR family transcriptional regulator
VHHVRGAADWLDAEARLKGWRAELEERHAPVPELLGGDWSAASGYTAGRRLAADPAVTAVFVANDQMAVGVMLALREAGRSVPESVSVVGFDDIPEAAFLQPPLTTIRQDFREMGRRCVQRLTAMIEGESVPREVSVAPDLVLRASTAPPPP